MVRIIVDSREKSGVPKELEKLGADLHFTQMPVGDYQVSHECAFEYKSPPDFLMSEVGDEKLKLRRQVIDMKASYPRCALLIGGSLPELLSMRNIHPNAIMAMIQSLFWLDVPVRFLVNEQIVANYIFETAKKEQGESEHKEFSPHGKRSSRTLDEQKVYTISSINDVGPTQALNLLKHFGNIMNIANASLEELMEVSLIGEQTALAIRENLQGVFYGGKSL